MREHSIVAIVIILLASVGGYFAYNQYYSLTRITDFESCAEARGSVIMESYPEQCRTRDGRTFVHEVNVSSGLGLTYILPQEWPPRVSVNGPELEACEDRVINGREYCVFEEVEGAAGSEYFSYKYETTKGDDRILVDATFKYVGCGNYFEVDNKMAECEEEQVAFDPDVAIDRIVDKLGLPVPSVTLFSPNGGEVWEIGLEQTILWEAQSMPPEDKVSIHIRRVPPPPLPEEGQEFDPLVFVGTENDGNEKWTVSDMYPEGKYILEVTAYSELPLVEGNHFSDESDGYFEIVRPSDQPKVVQ